MRTLLGYSISINLPELECFVELTSSAMGIDLSGEELTTIARRGINLEKAFNNIK